MKWNNTYYKKSLTSPTFESNYQASSANFWPSQAILKYEFYEEINMFVYWCYSSISGQTATALSINFGDYSTSDYALPYGFSYIKAFNGLTHETIYSTDALYNASSNPPTTDMDTRLPLQWVKQLGVTAALYPAAQPTLVVDNQIYAAGTSASMLYPNSLSKFKLTWTAQKNYVYGGYIDIQFQDPNSIYDILKEVSYSTNDYFQFSRDCYLESSTFLPRIPDGDPLTCRLVTSTAARSHKFIIAGYEAIAPGT